MLLSLGHKFLSLRLRLVVFVYHIWSILIYHRILGVILLLPELLLLHHKILSLKPLHMQMMRLLFILHYVVLLLLRLQYWQRSRFYFVLNWCLVILFRSRLLHLELLGLMTVGIFLWLLMNLNLVLGWSLILLFVKNIKLLRLLHVCFKVHRHQRLLEVLLGMNIRSLP